MNKIKEILDRDINDYSALAKQNTYFTNEKIAEILKDRKVEPFYPIYGDVKLEDKDMMTAILLKYGEYYNKNSKLDLDGFRYVWLKVKDSRFGGIDCVFENVLNRNNTGDLAKVIGMLDSDYKRKHFAEALDSASSIFKKLGFKEETSILENEIYPAMEIYIKKAKYFEQVFRRETYHELIEELNKKDNKGR